MVARIQQSRFITPGQRPTTGTERAGTLFVNLADQQIGMIDSAQAPVDLLPVRQFSTAAAYALGDIAKVGMQLLRTTQATGPGAFNATHWRLIDAASIAVGTAPTMPQVNDFWLDATVPTAAELKIWNGSAWVPALTAFLPRAGGALTGNLDITGTLLMQGLLTLQAGLQLGPGQTLGILTGPDRVALASGGRQLEVGEEGLLSFVTTDADASLGLYAASGKAAMLSVIGEQNLVQLSGIGAQVLQFLADGTLALPTASTNPAAATRKDYVDAKISADVTAAINALGTPLNVTSGDARYLRLTGGTLASTLTIQAGAAPHLFLGTSGLFYFGDAIGGILRGMHFNPNTTFGLTATGNLQLRNNDSYFEVDTGGVQITALNGEGGQIQFNALGGKKGFVDQNASSNELRIFHDMGRAVNDFMVWSYTNDGTFRLPTQTSQPTGATRKDYVDAVISAWATSLTAQINARLTQAQADALFLTPAEGNAAYLTPASGDARYMSGTFVSAGFAGYTRFSTTWYQNVTSRMRMVWVTAAAASESRLRIATSPVLPGVPIAVIPGDNVLTTVYALLPPGYYVYLDSPAIVNTWVELGT